MVEVSVNTEALCASPDKRSCPETASLMSWPVACCGAEGEQQLVDDVVPGTKDFHGDRCNDCNGSKAQPSA